MEALPGEITLLLADLQAGNRSSEARLMPLVYNQLRRVAGYYMRGERPDHTRQPTALVHETYLRLIGQREVAWQNRSHFYAVAACLMRNILVDHARARQAHKRGGQEQKVTFDEALKFAGGDKTDPLALDEALTRLARRDPRQARIVELRFFGGLSEKEAGGGLRHFCSHRQTQLGHGPRLAVQGNQPEIPCLSRIGRRSAARQRRLQHDHDDDRDWHGRRA